MSEPVDTNPVESNPFDSNPDPAVDRDTVAIKRTIPQVEKWMAMIREMSREEQTSGERTDQTTLSA